MSDLPLGYHITFGTYGTRLHGDPRGTVDRRMNQPGDPIMGAAENWQSMLASMLAFAPVRLSDEQRQFAEAAIPDVCLRGGWTLIAAAAQPDHVHVLLRATTDPQAVRRWLKSWLGSALSNRWPREQGQSWWAEGGSVKWVWNEDYLLTVRQYILKQRAT